MTEPVAVEKVEAVYIKHIERLERLLAEEKHDREQHRESFRQEYQERLKEKGVEFHNQKEELLAQNDGMLGAIGRLHTENESLKQRLNEAQRNVKDLEEMALRMKKDAEVDILRKAEMFEQEIDRREQEASKVIKELKSQVETLKGKAKKKA
jgi:uncharacterized protein (DUF2132 family)